MPDFLNPSFLVQTFGLVGVFAVVFAESGLLIGFFFPGDSLLFTAGFAAAGGYLPIIPLVVGSFLAAVLGDNVGYAFGKRVGPRIFTREDSLFFKRKHLERTRNFYEKHGGKTILLARFIPIVRTFAPILAGVGTMRYNVFLRWNILGGLLWAVGITLLGFFLGSVVPGADRYLLYLILIIVATSFLPVLKPVAEALFRHKKTRTPNPPHPIEKVEIGGIEKSDGTDKVRRSGNH